MSHPLYQLGEVCDFENGDRGKNYPSKDAFVPEGIPFINAGHLTDSGIDKTSLNFITEEHFHRLSNGKVKDGDILFCLRGSLGKFAVVKDIKIGAIASSLIIIRPKKGMDHSYLKHFLGSPLCKQEIYNFENGAAQPNLSASDLKKFKIPLPLIAEQKRIATILDKADAIRRKRQQAIKLADEFLRAVFLDMFISKNSSKTSWKKVIIEDVTSRVKTWNPLAFNGVTFEYIDLSSVDNDTKRIVNTKLFECKDAPSRARQLITQDDVLVSTVRPNLNGVAKVADVSENLTASTGFCVLRPKSELVTQNFLFHLVKSADFVNEMVSVATGASYPAVSDRIIRSFEFYLPPLSSQNEFDKICKSIEQYQTKNDKFSEKKIFESVSQVAFSGNL
ncbi:MAG: restriction endonuclease subunit S [Methylotenera sp.]|nr:restriction endonuclease subunit S [Methylotenera sp.]